ncbi:hypothetical protein MHL31_10500 [Lutibacter sp. A80]|uniref:hypothetical protein n=1 Tax=unclassified Lutibacter TaxID=2626258 RepID=UPI001F06E555|nr:MULTISPECIES: hypothetical protein [unclassified Lutibacter]UMB52994.1 hypothetical protein MKD41_11690 [Lutibacter sp. A64]UMB59508.1 hypothetical protein MHL31_10500 [Lutibacter sp. A80]
MKFTTVYLDDNKIEVFNSFLGKETVKVNGEIVSEIYSIFGATHTFKIKENEQEVECKMVIGFGFSGVVVDLYKNEKPIIESPKNGCLGFLLIVFAIAIVFRALDYFLGYLF